MATSQRPKTLARPSRALVTVTALVKLTAIGVGFAGTFVGLMAIVGAFTENGWIRTLAALIVGIGVPLFLADRALPNDTNEPVAGVVTDVLALLWFGFTLVFAGFLGSVARPLLAREGDRLLSAGWGTLARTAYFFGGVVPEIPPAVLAPAATSASAPVSASAPTSASAPLPAAPSASADPATSASAAKPRAERSPAEIFQALAPSVVTIFVKGKRGEGGGTGFLLDREGTLATNHHVIEDASAVRIKFLSGAVFEDVELLSDAPTLDLALLRVDLEKPADGGPGAEIDPLVLGDSDAVVVGERALSIGNPLGLEHTLTDGLISSRRIYEGRAWIQMSVPVSPGNSGGPLFNMRGEVVGVTTAGVRGGQNLNLAVPVNELRKLIQPAYPQRRKIGEGFGPTRW